MAASRLIEGTLRIRLGGAWITAINGMMVPPSDAPKRQGTFPQLCGKHPCACVECDPELRPPVAREGPAHFSIRWGREQRLHVFCGDREWLLVTEVVVGPGGWALIHSEPTHVCQECIRNRGLSRAGLCTYKVTCDVFSVRGDAS